MLSSALVRSVLDALPDAMVIIDSAGNILFANHQVEVEAATGVDLAGTQRAVEALVIRDRNQVQVGLLLDVLEQCLDAGGPVRVERVQVHVRLAPRTAAAGRHASGSAAR